MRLHDLPPHVVLVEPAVDVRLQLLVAEVVALLGIVSNGALERGMGVANVLAGHRLHAEDDAKKPAVLPSRRSIELERPYGG